MKKFLLRAPKLFAKAATLALVSASATSASAQSLADAIKLTDKEQFENVWRDKSPLAGEGTMAAPLDEEAL